MGFDTGSGISDVTITTGDLEIGAVELKDAATDVRASIVAANTARTTGTIVVATQSIDAAGAVLKTSAIETAVELIDNAVSGSGFNITQQGGVAVSLNTGVRDTGTQRVTIATNDIVPASQSGTWTEANSAAITTAVQLIDNAVSGAGFNITQVNGEAVDVGAGTEAAAIRVTLPTDGTGVVKLGAGTAEIGKLAAGTANIGDVDVLTITNASLNGPGVPVIDSYTSAAINAVTGTDQVLVAAPGANKQIWVYGIDFLTTVAGTVALQDEDNTVLTGVMNFPATGGLSKDPSGNFAMPWKKVATNKALEADVATATINGSIQYAIVSV